MMQSSWMWSLLTFTTTPLIAAVYVAGLVVTLRRWHLGTAPRLGAIGFGVLLVGYVGQMAMNVVVPLFVGSSGTTATESVMLGMVLTSAVGVILSVAGHLLIILALRGALIDFERSRNALPPGFGVDAMPDEVARR